jgi:hypothetical protein
MTGGTMVGPSPLQIQPARSPLVPALGVEAYHAYRRSNRSRKSLLICRGVRESGRRSA